LDKQIVEEESRALEASKLMNEANQNVETLKNS
jgi:hypothetical protein